jgi:hypothetical protein
MNGKAGDHPLTDILVHGLPVFSPEVDALIKEINEPVRRWDGQLVPFLLLVLQSHVRQLRENDRDADADTLLHNLAWTLRGERDRFR